MGFFSKLFGRSEKAPAFDGNKIYAPLNGKAVPVTEVPDPTFAEGLLGNGIAIITPTARSTPPSMAPSAPCSTPATPAL